MFQIVPGTIIDDRYQVVSRVGSGGMAEVYCADDLQLGRRVAVKLLHERFAQDPEFVERFRREASSAASLSHANIVSVFDRGEWGGTYYIAMELLEGRSLDTIVREEAPLTPERAIELTEQVLRAARFAHKHGVVHRDLKPHNVIIDDEGRVKVTDFGIARAGASEITQTGSIMGTARYLSPEQAQGEAVGPRSDLYAIGILLYELLTGTVPFEGESVVASRRGRRARSSRRSRRTSTRSSCARSRRIPRTGSPTPTSSSLRSPVNASACAPRTAAELRRSRRSSFPRYVAASRPRGHRSRRPCSRRRSAMASRPTGTRARRA
jgi:serine/threonine protein kinase